MGNADLTEHAAWTSGNVVTWCDVRSADCILGPPRRHRPARGFSSARNAQGYGSHRSLRDLRVEI
ncbi:hypothetical protein H257_08936 [Aphanomyces astaci]|uniref:Uncharacterized protein n=1 Tax=Aphanomyces astaci TaxID=112090 RepID=W4GBI2_APHAT|nr:hypothetical protein H257_08936 [Aphanomyces astaci]ETV77020.1 hypothetical protein H257_08936 [Aphanomyces astaci]|eukprot:XP_009833326.1 hypothetical protein H257_08936 [Aphanomyces astaci]